MPHRKLLTESQRLSLHAPASDERGIGAPLHVELRGSSADQSSPRRSHGKLRVLPVILPGGERAKEILRSHSAFAIAADSFDRTSFHGFLAKAHPPPAWSVA